jgi:hypothetical protein
MNDERWAEDTVRMGQHGPPRAPEVKPRLERRRLPLPTRRTLVEIAVGLVVAIALVGARDGGDTEPAAVGAKHPVSRIATPAKEDAAPLNRHEVKVKPITTNRRRKEYRDRERERHDHRRRARPSPPAHPEPQPAPAPAPVEAPPVTVIYPEPAPPPPAPTEAPPPTSPSAEFGM